MSIVIPLGIIGAIISAILYAFAQAERNQEAQKLIESKEKENVVQQISTFDTSQLKVEYEDDGCIALTMTLRNFSLYEKQILNYNAKANHDKKAFSINVSISSLPLELDDHSTGQVSLAYSSTINNAGRQSDDFLMFLAELWNLDPPRKYRMRREVFGRVYNFHSSNNFRVDDVFDFDFHFTTLKDEVTVPVLGFYINWSKGILKIREKNLAHRQVIFDKLKSPF